MPLDVVGLIAAFLAIVAVAVTAWLSHSHAADTPEGPVLGASDPSIAPLLTATEASAGGHGRAHGRAHVQEPRPVRIRIPAIGVDARVVRLGLAADGTMQTPTDYAHTGWFAPGPEPGERGAAVIAGHVDSKTGPAAFYNLGRLRRGDAIRITVAGGRTISFRVDGLERWPKAKFPTRRVFGPTRDATLRLITCSGAFDRQTGHYLDNTIVYAVRGTAGRN